MSASTDYCGNYVVLMTLSVASGMKLYVHIVDNKDKESVTSDRCFQAVCKNLYGAYLVEINSLEENLFLELQARTHNRTFWIGLEDLERDGHWVWATSKQPLSSSGFTDWAPGDPNNLVDGEEGCVTIFKQSNYHWADVPCNWDNPHYICEKDEQSISPVG